MKRDAYPPNKLRKWHRRAETIARRAKELVDDFERTGPRDPMLVKFGTEVKDAADTLARRIDLRREKSK